MKCQQNVKDAKSLFWFTTSIFLLAEFTVFSVVGKKQLIFQNHTSFWMVMWLILRSAFFTKLHPSMKQKKWIVNWVENQYNSYFLKVEQDFKKCVCFSAISLELNNVTSNSVSKWFEKVGRKLAFLG